MKREAERNLKSKLFPRGMPSDPSGNGLVLFEQYKMFVETSENLVVRRQVANRFFFSANALTMSAIGLGISLLESGFVRIELIAIGIFVLSVVGCVLCYAWRRLVNSFAQLNKAKFTVIHEIEKILPTALFTAEWYELGEGKDPDKYNSSTKAEMPAIPARNHTREKSFLNQAVA